MCTQVSYVSETNNYLFAKVTIFNVFLKKTDKKITPQYLSTTDELKTYHMTNDVL